MDKNGLIEYFLNTPEIFDRYKKSYLTEDYGILDYLTYKGLIDLDEFKVFVEVAAKEKIKEEINSLSDEDINKLYNSLIQKGKE